jgi:hypothetical protein
LKALEKKLALKNYTSHYKQTIGAYDERKVQFPPKNKIVVKHQAKKYDEVQARTMGVRPKPLIDQPATILKKSRDSPEKK